MHDARHADIIRQATTVDPELRPALVQRTVTSEDDALVMYT